MKDDSKLQEERKDFRRVRSARGALTFRLLGIFVVVVWLWDIVSAYIKGGPDAPTLTVLILAIVLLGGGSVGVGFLTWKAWQVDQEAARLSAEEAAQIDALRQAEEAPQDVADAPLEPEEDAKES